MDQQKLSIKQYDIEFKKRVLIAKKNFIKLHSDLSRAQTAQLWDTIQNDRKALTYYLNINVHDQTNQDMFFSFTQRHLTNNLNEFGQTPLQMAIKKMTIQQPIQTPNKQYIMFNGKPLILNYVQFTTYYKQVAKMTSSQALKQYKQQKAFRVQYFKQNFASKFILNGLQQINCPFCINHTKINQRSLRAHLQFVHFKQCLQVLQKFRKIKGNQKKQYQFEFKPIIIPTPIYCQNQQGIIQIQEYQNRTDVSIHDFKQPQHQCFWEIFAVVVYKQKVEHINNIQSFKILKKKLNEAKDIGETHLYQSFCIQIFEIFRPIGLRFFGISKFKHGNFVKQISEKQSKVFSESFSSSLSAFKYNKGLTAFANQLPYPNFQEPIIARQCSYQKLKQFINTCKIAIGSKFLHICGSVGIGKTTLIQYAILKNSQKDTRFIQINFYGKQLCHQLLKKLSKEKTICPKVNWSSISNKATQRDYYSVTTIVIIQQAQNINKQMLQALKKLQGFHYILVTNNVNSFLKKQIGFDTKIENLIVPPYTKFQIQQIIDKKFQYFDVDIFQKGVLGVVYSRICRQDGDLRRCISQLQKLIFAYIESNKKSKVTQDFVKNFQFQDNKQINWPQETQRIDKNEDHQMMQIQFEQKGQWELLQVTQNQQQVKNAIKHMICLSKFALWIICNLKIDNFLPMQYLIISQMILSVWEKTSSRKLWGVMQELNDQGFIKIKQDDSYQLIVKWDGFRDYEPQTLKSYIQVLQKDSTKSNPFLFKFNHLLWIQSNKDQFNWKYKQKRNAQKCEYKQDEDSQQDY